MKSLTKSHPASPRLRLAVLVALGCLTVGAAHAAWQVTDEETHRTLSEISDRIGRGDVNDKLEELYDSQKLGGASSSGDPEPEPKQDEALPHAGPSEIIVGVDQRCPDAAAGAIAVQQRMLCEQIVEAERAKYMYSLRMYKLTETRWSRLKEIEDERKKLKAEEQGKLQDNSNKLLALISLMQIDQQQHKTYMDAYDARLSYLFSARDALTREALAGSGSGLVGGIAGAGTLAAALELVKTDRAFDAERRRRL